MSIINIVKKLNIVSFNYIIKIVFPYDSQYQMINAYFVIWIQCYNENDIFLHESFPEGNLGFIYMYVVCANKPI